MLVDWIGMTTKRSFDILVSLALLSVIWPLFLVVALFVRMRMGHPILFQQQRPGLNGRPFKMLKFRTMSEDRYENGSYLDDNARLTPLGKFLRSTSIDELPELINVLKGDMSLVGPRPLLLEYLPLYNDRQMRRHEVRPGITGWAQVNGRNTLSWQDKFELDVWYVENRSFWLDVRILFLTFIKAVKREGINQPGNPTMEKFHGN